MQNNRYMIDKSSFMPFVSFALIVGGGVFVGLIRNWNWGVLAVPAGVTLILAAVAFAVVVALVAMDKARGELMLLPAGLTFMGMLLHCINIILIKGSFWMRVELLLAAVFAVMILLMIASLRGRQSLDRQKTIVICIIICVMSLFACFMPVMLGRDGRDGMSVFMEVLESDLPLIFYFAAFLTYFMGLNKEEAA